MPTAAAPSRPLACPHLAPAVDRHPPLKKKRCSEPPVKNKNME